MGSKARRLLLAMGLMVLAGVALWVSLGPFLRSGVRPRQPVPAAVQPTPAVQPALSPNALDDADAKWLHGRVFDGNGAAAANVRVVAEPSPEQGVTTDAHGYFRFAVALPACVVLHAQAPTGERAVGWACKGEANGLHLVAPVFFDVSVVEDRKDAAVSNANVFVCQTPWEQVSVTMRGLATVGSGAVSPALCVHADGFAPWSHRVVAAAEHTAVEARLLKGAQVAGNVRNAAGATVAGVRVQATDLSDPSFAGDTTVSDANGAWVFPTLAASSYDFAADDGVHEPAHANRVETDGDRDVDGVEIVLSEELADFPTVPESVPASDTGDEEPVHVRGRLAFADGSSPTETYFIVNSSSPQMNAATTLQAQHLSRDGHGGFAFELPHVPYVGLVFRGVDFLDKAVFKEALDGNVDFGDIEVRRGATLRGVVRTEAGQVVDGAHVWVHSFYEDKSALVDTTSGTGRSTRTDVHGAFVLTNIDGGDTPDQVEARHATLGRSAPKIVDPNQAMELVLQGTGTLKGRVLRDGNAVPFAEVSASATAGPTSRVKSGSDGVFRMTELMAGSYDVSTPSYGFDDDDNEAVLEGTALPVVMPATVVAGQETALDLTFSRERVTVEIIPVGRFAASSMNSVMLFANQLGDSPNFGHLGAKGRYLFTSAPPGSYIVCPGFDYYSNRGALDGNVLDGSSASTVEVTSAMEADDFPLTLPDAQNTATKADSVCKSFAVDDDDVVVRFGD